MPLLQLRRLLCQRDDRGEHVIPQLAELAAWTAGYHDHFRDHVLSIEPELLLRSDVTQQQSSFKPLLVKALLEGAEAERIFDDFSFGRFVDGLNHPGLAAQLTPYIADKTRHFIARRIALRIAQRCQLQELTDVALRVAHDVADNPNIRDEAARTLEQIVPEDRLEVLEPLARGEVLPDENDRIKGCALRRLVPARWKLRDAWPYLTSPRNARSLGSYELDLRQTFPKFVEEADVVPCLSASMAAIDFGCSSLHNLLSALVVKALSMLELPCVATLVTELWLKNWEGCGHQFIRHDPEITNALRTSSVRRNLVTLCLNDPQTREDDVLLDCQIMSILNDSEDLAWLLHEISSAPPLAQPTWASAIARFASNPQISAQCWDLLLQRISEIPALAQEFSWLRAWDLNEPIALKAKEEWHKNRRAQAKFERRLKRRAGPSVREGLDQAFAEFNGGGQEAWWKFWCHVTRGDKGSYKHQFECDLTKCPNWLFLTLEEKAQSLKMARSFLFALECQASGINGGSNLGLASSAAIWLLREALVNDVQLVALVKRTWLPVLVWHADWCSEECRGLFALAYRIDPAAALQEILRLAEEDLHRHGHPFAFRAAKNCWDGALADAFANLLSKPLPTGPLLNGLAELAALDKPCALKVAEKIIAPVEPGVLVCPIGLLAGVATGLMGSGGILVVHQASSRLGRSSSSRGLRGSMPQRWERGTRLLLSARGTRTGGFLLALSQAFPGNHLPAFTL